MKIKLLVLAVNLAFVMNFLDYSKPKSFEMKIRSLLKKLSFRSKAQTNLSNFQRHLKTDLPITWRILSKISE